MKIGDLTFICFIPSQSIPLNHGCSITSLTPPLPRRSLGLRLSKRLIKSITFTSFHPLGRSFCFKCISFVIILSFISFFVLPAYGRFPIISSNVNTPNAKKSTKKFCGFFISASGAMYPGVPLESITPSSISSSCAMPKSVKCRYPLESNTKFSGLTSRWNMRWECMYCKHSIMLARINLVSCSVYCTPSLKW